jgi:hypothetical protein
MERESLKMGRPIELAEPLASIAIRLGGIQALRHRLGGVSPSTIHRWSDKIRRQETLPPLVQLAIANILNDFAKESPCLNPPTTSSPSFPPDLENPIPPRRS